MHDLLIFERCRMSQIAVVHSEVCNFAMHSVTAAKALWEGKRSCRPTGADAELHFWKK